MFIWDFSVIIALVATVFLSLVIYWWLFYINKINPSDNKCQDWQALKQCPYCAYVLLDHLNRSGLICPRCKSILDDNKG